MAARLKQRTSRSALWSRRLVVFMVPVAVIAALAHRFDLIDTPTAMTVLGIAWVGCGAAIVLGMAGIVAIWRYGIEGLRGALAGIFIGVPMLIIPAYFIWLLFTQPQLRDITTDTLNPPAFDMAAGQRAANANPLAYPGIAHAALQERHFPEIRPFRTGLSTEDAYKAALGVAEEAGWRIVAQVPPPDGDSAGRIEAVATTLLMGFRDDVVIRITPDQGGSRLDIRSASRFGTHDFGANARRVRAFLFAVREALAPTAGGER